MPQDNLEENSVPVASHNVAVRLQDQSSNDKTGTSWEIEDGNCSEIPADLDLRAARVQEVPGSRNPDGKPGEVSVNMIGDTSNFKPDEGGDVNLELGDSNQGVLLMTAQVGANSFNLADLDREFIRQVRILLDSAAQRSFISEHLVRKLGLVHVAVGTFKLSTLHKFNSIPCMSPSCIAKSLILSMLYYSYNEFEEFTPASYFYDLYEKGQYYYYFYLLSCSLRG